MRAALKPPAEPEGMEVQSGVMVVEAGIRHVLNAVAKRHAAPKVDQHASVARELEWFSEIRRAKFVPAQNGWTRTELERDRNVRLAEPKGRSNTADEGVRALAMKPSCREIDPALEIVP